MMRAEAEAQFKRLLDLGAEHDLGGTGEPVAIVVVYPRSAFVKAAQKVRNREDVVQGLMDALTDEARTP